VSLTITDLECTDADQFVELCKRELKVYPRSPVVVTTETAKDIDMSGIHRFSKEQLEQALREFGEAA
jgi:hypothetical protein